MRESARQVPGDTLVDRLIAELLEASSRKDVRNGCVRLPTSSACWRRPAQSWRPGRCRSRRFRSARIEEAVKLYRELAASRPDAFRPDLASSLYNLSARLGDLGRREEELAAAKEAVGERS